MKLLIQSRGFQPFLTTAAHTGLQLCLSTWTLTKAWLYFIRDNRYKKLAAQQGEKIKIGEEKGKKSNEPYFIIFYKVHKSCPLYFHGLPLSVVESQNKVKEIGFPQVGGWLLFKVGSGQSYSAVEETHGMGWGGGETKTLPSCAAETAKQQQKRQRARSELSLVTAGLQPSGTGRWAPKPQFRRGPAPCTPQDNADLQRGVCARGSECFPSSAYFPACHRSSLGGKWL